MDRQFAYTGAIPQTRDILSADKNTMVALGYALQAFLGPCATPLVDGLALAATLPASLSVTVGAGSIHSSQVVDQNAYGDLGTDTTHTIVKQGILQDPVTLTVTAPATSGYSQNYLVQVAFSEVDGGSLVLPYYNAANPAVPFAGPANAGTSNYTVRQGKVVVQLKAGTAASTGSQTTPAPDAGFVGLYVITVANGATSVTSSNFATLATAPFISIKLPQVRAKILQESDNFLGTVGGTANALTASVTAPGLSTWADLTGAKFVFVTASANTSASPTINITLNGTALGAKTMIWSDGSTIPASAWGTTSAALGYYDGTNFVVLAGAVKAQAAGDYIFEQTATGAFNWTCPANGFYSIELLAAGAGGGAGAGSGAGGGGGGGEKLVWKKFYTNGQVVAGNLGAAGAGGAGPNSSGTSGVDSTFDGYTAHAGQLGAGANAGSTGLGGSGGSGGSTPSGGKSFPGYSGLTGYGNASLGGAGGDPGGRLDGMGGPNSQGSGNPGVGFGAGGSGSSNSGNGGTPRGAILRITNK